MPEIKLYNTLTRKKDEFKPRIAGEVGLYTCGPTVYNSAHLGNLRAYLFEDLLKRVLTYNGLKVKHIMNITDVGHLTGDGDMGEDKLEKGARREGKTAWDVAKRYELEFIEDLKHLNIMMPDKFTRATEYIEAQISLVKILEQKSYTYRTSDGIYFDTAKFPEYNKLSHLDLETLREGARVEVNDEKRNPTDFALWKFSPAGAKRDMEWESPWGVGFPGWHIECSAMSQAELGNQLDIHCGGIDHINVHHTNEIAQSEAAYGGQFFDVWMHGAFLNVVGGKKMAKSDDNFLTLANALIKRGINPLVYRFAAMQTHYRKPMEYGDEIIENARRGYEHLLNQVKGLGNSQGAIDQTFREKFCEAINDDLNLPQALAVAQELLKSSLDNDIKLATILDFDRVFGLKLEESVAKEIGLDMPAGKQSFFVFGSFTEDELDYLRAQIATRLGARAEKDWAKADEIRVECEARGFRLKDTPRGIEVSRL